MDNGQWRIEDVELGLNFYNRYYSTALYLNCHQGH